MELDFCAEGNARAQAVLQDNEVDIELLDALADAIDPVWAFQARRRLGMTGTSEGPVSYPDDFGTGTDDFNPTSFAPDNLAPGESTYGDAALDGSGASYARIK